MDTEHNEQNYQQQHPGTDSLFKCTAPGTASHKSLTLQHSHQQCTLKHSFKSELPRNKSTNNSRKNKTITRLNEIL